MAILTRDALRRASRKRRTVDVAVPEFGARVEIRLRALSVGDTLQFRREIQAAQDGGEDAEERALYLIARSWIDGKGELLFEEAEGVAVLKDLCAETYNRLARAALKLNGLDDAAVQEAEKN